jgi:hypothetical protein
MIYAKMAVPALPRYVLFRGGIVSCGSASFGAYHEWLRDFYLTLQQSGLICFA